MAAMALRPERRLRSTRPRPEPREVLPFVHARALCESADIAAGVVVEAGAFVGAGASLAAGCRIGSCAWVEGAVGEHARIGSGALVAAGVRVGARGFVRRGSVVLRDVAPGETVGGDPAERVA